MRFQVDSTTRALLAVVAVALVADALLGALTGAVSSVGGGPSAPWWVNGHLVERSRWVVFVLLLWGLVRVGPVAELASPLDRAGAAWKLVGVLAITVPLLWMLALWLVQAALFTAAGRWDIDGQVFFSADYYRRVLAGYAPWLLGGAAALVLSRHAS